MGGLDDRFFTCNSVIHTKKMWYYENNWGKYNIFNEKIHYWKKINWNTWINNEIILHFRLNSDKFKSIPFKYVHKQIIDLFLLGRMKWEDWMLGFSHAIRKYVQINVLLWEINEENTLLWRNNWEIYNIFEEKIHYWKKINWNT